MQIWKIRKTKMAAAAPQGAVPGKGRRTGSRNFTVEESMGYIVLDSLLHFADFLCVVHTLRPAGAISWDRTAAEYELGGKVR